MSDNNIKFKSLTTTNSPIALSISDIIDNLKSELELQASMLDKGTIDLILNADDDLLDDILSNYDGQLIWNLNNTSLGKGILIGLLIGSISSYFDNLNEEIDDDGEIILQGERGDGH